LALVKSYGLEKFETYMTSWFMPFETDNWKLVIADVGKKYPETVTGYFGGRPDWFVWKEATGSNAVVSPVPIVIKLTMQASGPSDQILRPYPSQQEISLLELLEGEHLF